MNGSYSETAVTVFVLAALAIGTLAQALRWALRSRQSIGNIGRQFVADVRRGEGFTFHKIDQRPQELSAKPLALRQWLDVVNHRPDQVPHLFVEGGSGAGKTTLTTAILHDRRDPVAVVGVKPDDGWGEGYVYRSADRPAFLARLLAEVRRRLDEDDRSGITIVLDDFTRLTQHKEAVELYKEVADVGRSLRIRLILVARGRQVKGIGAQGESDLLDHFAFLHVSRHSHAATLEIEEETAPLDTREVKRLAQPLPHNRFWTPIIVSAPKGEIVSDSGDDESILISLLREPHGGKTADTRDTDMPAVADTPHQGAIPANDNEPEDIEGIPALLTPEDIRILYAAHRSKNKVAARLRGKQQKRLAIIDAALAEEPAHEVA